MSFADARQVLTFDYRVMTFLLSLGIIQIAASRSSLTGLWLMSRRETVRRIGWALFVAGLLFYFLAPLWQEGPWAVADDPTAPQAWHTASPGDLTAAHNISDTSGGLSGNTQAKLLITSAAAAILVSASLGAWTLRRRGGSSLDGQVVGTEALETGNLVDAVRSTWSIRQFDHPSSHDPPPHGESPAPGVRRDRS
ncbi:MAG: hypothetical protein WCE80_14330 [Acidimicrobiia bacterium]